VAEEFLQRILHTPSSRLCPSGDPASIQWFSGDAGPGIDIRRVHATILIRHPRHFARAGPHIWGRNILRRIDQIAFDQLVSKATRDFFKLMRLPVSGIDNQPAF